MLVSKCATVYFSFNVQYFIFCSVPLWLRGDVTPPSELKLSKPTLFFAHHFYWVSVEMLPNNPIIIYLTGPDEQRHVSTLQEKEVHTVVMTQEWLESSHTIWECIACSTFTKPFQVRFWLWYCCSSCCVKPIGGLLHCELCSDWSRSLQQNSN